MDSAPGTNLRPDNPGVDDPQARRLAVARLQKLERMHPGLDDDATVGGEQTAAGERGGALPVPMRLCGYSRSCRSFQFPRLCGDALILCRISQIRLVGRDRHTADDRYATGKARLLGIWTQWARPGSRSLHEGDLIRGGSEVHAGRIYWPWRGAVFNPVDERRKQVESVGCRSSGAMTHIRDRVESRELLSRSQAAKLLRHFFIVLDVAENWHDRIAEAMKPDDLVPVIDEASNIKRGGVGVGRSGNSG
jgi:hypothetical protein